MHSIGTSIIRLLFAGALAWSALADAAPLVAQAIDEAPLLIQVGSPGEDHISDVAAAPGDAIVIAGGFSETIDLDSGAGVAQLSSVRALDGFVAKFDADGKHLWSTRIAGRLADGANALACDAEGSVFVAGYFSLSAELGGAEPPIKRQSIGRRDAFAAKLSSDGKLLWALSLGGEEDDEALDVAADGKGGCFVTGYVTGLADIDTRLGFMLADARGGRDGFVVHLDQAGAFQWGTLIGAAGEDDCAAVAPMPGGGVCVAGSFAGSVTFDTPAHRQPSTTLKSAGKRDVFVAHYAADGSLVQATALGGTGDDRIAPGGIAGDSQGRVVLTGRFEARARQGKSVTLQSAGGVDAFVARVDASGQFLNAFALGGGRNDGGQGIACDSSGGFCVSGWFAAKADFDPGPGQASLKAISKRPLAFVASYDGAGAYRHAFSLGAAEAGDDGDPITPAVNATSLCFDSLGRCIIAGRFSGVADLDPGDDAGAIESAGLSDGFLLRLPADRIAAPVIVP